MLLYFDQCVIALNFNKRQSWFFQSCLTVKHTEASTAGRFILKLRVVFIFLFSCFILLRKPVHYSDSGPLCLPAGGVALLQRRKWHWFYKDGAEVTECRQYFLFYWGSTAFLLHEKSRTWTFTLRMIAVCALSFERGAFFRCLSSTKTTWFLMWNCGQVLCFTHNRTFTVQTKNESHLLYFIFVAYAK